MYENLSFRGNVIAFLKAMVLYVAHGEKWDKTMEEFVRWSFQYDMWCKMRFFGEEIEMKEGSYRKNKKNGPTNMLDLLPEVFTFEEAQNMRHRQSILTGDARDMLNNWKKRGYIELYGDIQHEKGRQQYIKTESYLLKHPPIAC